MLSHLPALVSMGLFTVLLCLACPLAVTAGALRAENPGVVIPADAVTTSGSGLDPDISPDYARFQAPHIAKARGAPVVAVQAAIDGQVQGRLFGFVGHPRVNVLTVNRALDARFTKGG